MYFSKIQLRPQAGEQLALRLMGDGYRLHQTLWKLFPESPQRDFLYRSIEQPGLPGFYLVSQREPQCADGLWAVQSKPYRPRLQPGQRLAFSLLANPVITRRDAQTGRAARHDVLMDAKKQQPELHIAELQQAVGEQWLGKRAEQHGFALQQTRVAGYRQHRLNGRGKRAIRYSTLEFEGLLEVLDPERLLHTLGQGIGPAKGFGCGLLLVRPA